ncbi:MAG: hypothetical protein CVV41_07005 [Candidatus Riflebacteria bacterium HGW-Riflebacteria-1]|jgi:hypothetical protein|nr:MAG: hypothetical protein CVV41_07005 [Candidatus Riflebacteria bacterium HGW-Riflebacteria-1]
MFRTKSLLVFAVVMMVALTSSVMALDTVTLRQNMWMWSQCEAVLAESLHFNFGHTPVISPEECYNEIEKARMIISKIVAEIASEKDMLEARAVADEFASMLDKEEEVGKTLHKLLDMQAKYIKAHHIY